MIRAVISDFGGVLTSPLIGSFARIQDEAGLPMESLVRALRTVTERDGEHPLFALERGEMSEREFLRVVGDAVREELGRDVEMHLFADRYWAAISHNEAFIAFLRSLRDGGVRLALLTNNVREWEPRWRLHWPIDELFETVVDSGFVGMRKPERGIYELTLSRLGLPAGECLFVDDLEINCTAAREVGMQAVVFRDTDQAIAEVRAALDGAGRA